MSTEQSVRFGPRSLNVTLNASGNGAVQFSAAGYNYQIDLVRVKVSTNTNEADCRVFHNNDEVDGTFTGSSGDTSDTVIYLSDGDVLNIVWTGGDVGATATATITGWQAVPNRGFRVGVN
jgi:hypothetical protein